MQYPLAAAAPLPPELLPHKLAPALADDINQPLSALECALHSNSCFVVIALRLHIHGTLHNSVISTFLLFGCPQEDWRSSCHALDKGKHIASSDMCYLSFCICSRTLHVTSPLYKPAGLGNHDGSWHDALLVEIKGHCLHHWKRMDSKSHGPVGPLAVIQFGHDPQSRGTFSL
jgi:hypothetical protein